MGIFSSAFSGVAKRFGFDVQRINSEQKAADFETGADAFASSIGSNFNENFSSFNNQKQQLQSYVEWVYTAASAIAEHCAAIDYRIYQNNTKQKNVQLGQKLLYYPREIQKLQQRKLNLVELKDGQYHYRKGVSPLEELETHPLLDLLMNPNPYIGKNEFLEITFLHILLTGDAFWVIDRTKKNGKPAELWPLMPDRVTVVPDKENFVIGYEYQVNGEKVQFAPDDVIHHKLANPTNFHRGYSPIAAGARTIDTDAHAANWNRMVMYNGATPSGVFKTDAKLDDKTFKRLKQEIVDTFGGASNHGRPAVLEQGLDFKAIALNQKDMDFLNMRKFNRDQILAIMGVPKSVVGLDESMSRANAETAEYVFSKRNRNKMQRLVNRITEDLAIQFAPNLIVSFTDPVPEDKHFLLEETKAALNLTPWQTINEERAKRGDDPIDGGNDIWMSNALIPLGQAANNPKVRTGPPSGATEGSEDPDVDQDDEEGSDDSGEGDNASGGNESGTSQDPASNSGGESGSTTSETTNDSGNQASFTDAQLKQLRGLFKELIKHDQDLGVHDVGPQRRIPDGYKLCECCDGYGEHIVTGYECYRCDAAGLVNEKNNQPIPCGGREDSDELWIDEEGHYRHTDEERPVEIRQAPRPKVLAKADNLPDFPKPLADPMQAPENVILPPFPPTIPDGPIIGASREAEEPVRMQGKPEVDVLPSDAKLKINKDYENWFERRAALAIKSENSMLRGATEVFLIQKHEVLSNLPIVVNEKAVGARKVKESKKKMNKLFDKTVSSAAWAGMLTPAYTSLAQKSGDMAMEIANDPEKFGYDALPPAEPLTFDSSTEPIKQYFAERSSTISKGIDEETDKQLRATLVEGISNGESLIDLSDRVERVYGAASGYRAMRIARTETQQALHFSSFQSWDQSGLNIQKWIWLNRSPNPCPRCLDLDNVVMDKRSEFPNGGPTLHPNCTCSLVPFQINGFKVPGLGDESVKMFPKSIVKYSADQARDDHGRFADEGGGHESSGGGGSGEGGGGESESGGGGEESDGGGGSESGSGLKKTTATQKQVEALNMYTSWNYASINNYARGGDISPTAPVALRTGEKSTVGETVTHLDQMISKNTAQKDTIAFRGFSLPAADAAALQSGRSILERGYTSTSLNEQTARDFALPGTKGESSGLVPVLMKISVGATTNGVYVDKTSGAVPSAESEFLMGRGTSFTITGSQQKSSGGYNYTEVTAVAHGA